MSNWADQAEVHWKEFQPRRYADLENQGQEVLRKALGRAVRRTKLEMDQLVDIGVTEYEAWQMTREKYLFPPPEEEVILELEKEN